MKENMDENIIGWIVFLTLIYYALMIPTIVEFLTCEPDLKKRITMLEARIYDLERKA